MTGAEAFYLVSALAATIGIVVAFKNAGK